jgi:hypothetical protein
MKEQWRRTLGVLVLTGSVLHSPVHWVVTASVTEEEVRVRVEVASWVCGSSHDRTIRLGGESLPGMAVCDWVSILGRVIAGRPALPLSGMR